MSSVRCGNIAHELKFVFDTDVRNQLEAKHGSGRKWVVEALGVCRFLVRPYEGDNEDREGNAITRFDASRNGKQWQIRFTGTSRPPMYRETNLFELNDVETYSVRDDGLYVVADPSLPYRPKPHKQKKDSPELPNLIDADEDIEMRRKQAGNPQSADRTEPTADEVRVCDEAMNVLNDHLRRGLISWAHYQYQGIKEFAFNARINGNDVRHTTPRKDRLR